MTVNTYFRRPSWFNCYRLKNLLESEKKAQRRLFRRTVRGHLCERHKLEDVEEIRDGRIWWAWWLQIESTKNPVRINYLMKEYPNSMVTKPLLIEFSISHRTEWRHQIPWSERRVLPMQTRIGLHLNKDGPNPNNWKRLVGRTAWIRRHSKQSNGTLRLCRYRLGNLEAGVLMGVVYRCEVLGSAWGLYAAAGGVARDSWRMQKKSGWTNEYDGLDDRGSSDSRARCWSYIRFDEGTYDFDNSWLLIEFIFSVVVMRPLPMTWTAQGYVMKLLGDLSIGNRENKQR